MWHASPADAAETATPTTSPTMKKIAMLAAMALVASSAFAQEDALKSILKLKDYNEAKQQLAAAESSFNSEQKAKAYNKLTELALAQFNQIGTVVTQNQLNEQMGQKDKVVAYDTTAYNTSAYNAVKAAIECNKYDEQPNAKGKVSPKFKKNAQNVYSARQQLVNAGQDAGRAGNDADALKYWGFFVDSASDPLFASVDKTAEKAYFGQVAYFAGVYAYQAKDYVTADKYATIAMNDSSQYKDALNLKLTIMGLDLKTREDSVAYAKKLEDIYNKDKSNDAVFSILGSTYTALKDDAKLNSLIDDKLATDPNNSLAWAMRGQDKMNKGSYDDAISAFKKSVEAKNDNALVLTYLGFCINAKASTENTDAAKQKELCTEAAQYLEKARDIDPNRQVANWCYPLYNSYYVIYGAEDSRTKELENMLK